MKIRKRTLRFVRDPSTDGASSDGRRHVSVLRRNASEVMNYRVAKKIILIAVAIGMAALLIGYAFVLLYDRTGRFSVAVENQDVAYVITLSESPEFKTKSSRLTNDQQVRMTNICGDSIPRNVDNVDGQHNGENYLAYTFYCKNVGVVPTDMYYELTYNNVTNHVDECMRVRLYVDGIPTDYAKTKSDGTGNEEHYCDASFAGKYLVCRDIIENVEPERYVKFTVVIWVEGDDEDCNDSVLNGKIKFDMNIEAKPTDEGVQTENTESNG